MKILYLFLFNIILFPISINSKLFESKSFELQNGLKVIVIENNRAPVVTQMLWYDVGSKDEPNGKSGIAHFLEHLMFKGTKTYPGGYFSNFISKNGGSENAFTSFDYTAYYQVVPSNIIEKIVELEADRMKNLTLTKKQVDTEKNVILEERNQRIDSKPSSILDESMRKSLFPNHNYGIPIIGWKHEIEALQYNDVLDFYRKFYDPSNAILVFSGDINLSRAKKLATKYFGKIKSRNDIFSRKNLIDPPSRTSINIEYSHKDVKQPIWKRIYKTSSYNQNLKQSIALDIGLKILAGGSTSILYDEFVKKKKILSAIGGYFQGMSKYNGTIYFYAIPNKKVNFEELEIEIDSAIKNAIENKITEEKFLIQKKKYLYDSIYLRDSITQPAQIIGEAVTVGLTLNQIEDWDETIKDLKLEEVQNALKLFLENKDFVNGILQ